MDASRQRFDEQREQSIIKRMIRKKLRDFFSRFPVVKNLFLYFWNNKMWWLMPMVAILVIVGIVLIIGQATPLGAFIYTIF
jgi:hypothetical protein